MTNDALPQIHTREPGQSPLTEHDIYLFREGTHTRLHGRLGCRLGADGAHFAVWAPNARAVALIGDCNGWDAAANPMNARWDSSEVGTAIRSPQRKRR